MDDQKVFYQKWDNGGGGEEDAESDFPAIVPSQTVIVLAAGGTGGHVMPAISVGQILTDQGFKVFYVTDQRCGHYFENRGISTDILLEMPFAGLGEKSLKNVFPIIGKMTKGLLNCKKFFKRIKPDIVIGFGGYTTFPPLMMASLLKIPFILYEPDSYLGIVNRFFVSKAKIIATGFQRVKNVPKKVHARWVGMPVRIEFKQLRYSDSPAREKFTIIVIGGSQGAALFSTVLPKAIALLPVALQQKLHIIQQVRAGLEMETQKIYQQTQVSVTLQNFFSNIWGYMHQADIVISRAGASTVAEIAMLGKPALLIPYRYASNDHQKENACSLVQEKAAWMIEEPEFVPAHIAQFLEKIYADDQERSQVASNAKVLAKENAAENMAQLIVEIINKSS